MNTRVLVYGVPLEGRKVPMESQIRHLRLAQALAEHGHHVDVNMPVAPELAGLPDFSAVSILNTPISKRHLSRYQTAIVPIEMYPHGIPDDLPLVVNLQAPVFCATLPPAAPLSFIDAYYFARRLALQTHALRRADHFICASEHQRLFYLGMLANAGRLNNLTIDCLSSLLSVISPGVGRSPSPGIDNPTDEPEHPLVVWPSGVYDWYDPLPLVHAMTSLKSRLPHLRLVFAGARNPTAPDLSNANLHALHALVNTLRLGKVVGFTDWVPYAHRATLYHGAAIGVCLAKHGLESQLAWRARVVDMLAHGLPVVVTAGDGLADLVTRYGAGCVLSESVPETIADAIGRLLTNHDALTQARMGVRQLVARELCDVQNVAPLSAFCATPEPPPDRRHVALAPILAEQIALHIRHGIRERLYLAMRRRFGPGRGP